jgi:predicted dehydrogenase
MTEVIHRRRFLGQTATGASGLALSAAVGLAEEKASPDDNVNVGVITNAGGAHLSHYFAGLAKAEEVGSVVLADPDGSAEPMARQSLGDKLTGVYRSRDELLARETIQLALVSLEARLAPPAIDACLDAGCHVAAEKPACVNAADFEKLVDKADANERHLMLALANRLNPEVLEAQRLITTGELGAIYGLEMHLIEDQTRLTRPAYHQTWYADKNRAGGGHLTWLGLHWLDLAMYITGASIKQVVGFTGNVGGQPLNIEDSVAMAMQFDNGTFGTMTSGYYLDKGYQSHLKVWGSEGWLRIESDKARSLNWYSNKKSKSAAGETYKASEPYDAYAAFIKAAVRASAGLQEPPITGRECLRVLNVVYGLYDAAETGAAVSL